MSTYSDTDLTISERLARVREALEASCHAVGRDPADVCLVAVSKRVNVAALLEAVAAGQVDFAENYLRDALPKIEACAGYGLRWHMIGQLQSNKAARVAQAFDVVQSLTSAKAARAISRAMSAAGPRDVLIQVKLGGGAERGGVAIDEVPELAAEVADLPGVRLCGLMGVAPVDGPARPAFARLRRAFEDLRAAAPGGAEITELSAGMSGDFADAIAEGATIVRIGSAIF